MSRAIIRKGFEKRRIRGFEESEKKGFEESKREGFKESRIRGFKGSSGSLGIFFQNLELISKGVKWRKADEWRVGRLEG